MNNITAKRLRLLREERGLSIRQLEEELGFPENHYKRLEEPNRAGYRPEIIDKLASFYDVSGDYLLGRTDERRDTTKYSKETWDMIDRILIGIHNGTIKYDNM